MIVPTYWAEARQQSRQGGRSVTVRRFGWSDESQSEALAMAEARSQQALQEILAGEKRSRRERRVPYNGSDGVPIREEVVARHGDAVVSRNAYGARCLNTPDILFADVDFGGPAGGRLTLATAAILAGLGSLVVNAMDWSAWAGAGVVAAAILLANPVASIVQQAWRAARGGPEGFVRKRLASFVKRHPDWGLRLYRTPAGLRLMATHTPMDPHDPVVREFFGAIGVDPIYARMCAHQRCFRARLTAKPWRIGLKAHLKPRPGVWPVRPERRAERDAWIAEYERRAQGYAACVFVESVGSTKTHPKAAAIVDLHDSECRACQTELPLA